MVAKAKKRDRNSMQQLHEKTKEIVSISTKIIEGNNNQESDDINDILSAELRAELGGNKSDILVLPSSRKKKSIKKENEITEDEFNYVKKMSKAKRKKLEQIEARKVKEAKREQLFQSLDAQKLTQKAQQLMIPTSKAGQKATLRERLSRAMIRHNAGLKLTEEEHHLLFVERQIDDIVDDNLEYKVKHEQTRTPANYHRNTRQSETEKLSPDVINKPLSVNTNTIESKNYKKRKKKTRLAEVTVPMISHPAKKQKVIEKSLQNTTKNVSNILSVDNILQSQIESVTETTTKQTASQLAAMERLEALRKKNEEKRRLKEAKVASHIPDCVSIEAFDSNRPTYVPEPITLYTTKEMIEMSKSSNLKHKASLVSLNRKPDIQMARMTLPVCSSEQEIMEAIEENDVVIICGETGSGKTTQVPQFLYEAGYGHPNHKKYSGCIGVTQPRRVAAVSTAKRVAEELNVPFGGKKGHVGYQIRYDAANVNENTRIKFMTDGILLKEIQQDFLLTKYSIILLDEAHERNINTDILIGLLSRIAPLRAELSCEELEAASTSDLVNNDKTILQPLKLVIMSATLRVEDFTNNRRLFPTPPPVIRINARQHPVTIHFKKTTELNDYVGAAYKQVMKIHQKLPEGGILVFLTGQTEIIELCRKLKRNNKCRLHKSARQEDKQSSYSKLKPAMANRDDQNATRSRLFLEHDDADDEADWEEQELYGAIEDDDDEVDEELLNDISDDEDEDNVMLPYLHVLPLYSLLPSDQQLLVFQPPPNHHRLVVVATNVAETSLTIPNITYVVDAGRTKARVYDSSNSLNMSTFKVQWISKASANQRAGRAGRTGPGHCYRLYSSALFNTEFPEFSPPEISMQPIDDLLLQMKAMGIPNVQQFPFPTPPKEPDIKNALELLRNLGAIEQSDKEVEKDKITPLGELLVQFPVAARFAKMLLLAKECGVLEYTIAIVAALSGHSPFVSDVYENDDNEYDEQIGASIDDGNEEKSSNKDNEESRENNADQGSRKIHPQWIHQDSDVFSLLRAAGAFAFTGGDPAFCEATRLHLQTMQNMLKLRSQLTRIVNQLFYTSHGHEELRIRSNLVPPDETTELILRQIVTAGFLDQVAHRVPHGTIQVGTKMERNCAYIVVSNTADSKVVYIHPQSSVFTLDPAKLPEFVVYQHIMTTSRSYMKTVTAVEGSWIANIGKKTLLCSYSLPLSEPKPQYDTETDTLWCYVNAYYGKLRWPLPMIKIPFPNDIDSSVTNSKHNRNDKYRWFAKYMLDGLVIPAFHPFSAHLIEPSHTVIRKKFDKKIQQLVSKLASQNIDNRAAIIHQWQREPLFMQAELAEWVKQSEREVLLKSWMDIVRQAIASQFT